MTKRNALRLCQGARILFGPHWTSRGWHGQEELGHVVRVTKQGGMLVDLIPNWRNGGTARSGRQQWTPYHHVIRVESNPTPPARATTMSDRQSKSREIDALLAAIAKRRAQSRII